MEEGTGQGNAGSVGDLGRRMVAEGMEESSQYLVAGEPEQLPDVVPAHRPIRKDGHND